MGEITPSRKIGRARGYIDDYRAHTKTRVLLNSVVAVLNEYRNHWPLTCRQIFYRLVGAHGFDKSEAVYKNLCHHIANARRGRVIPFDAIRDDGVSTIYVEHFADADGFHAKVRHMADNYTRNKLTRQPYHIEVWCEAAGMIQQLADVAELYSVQVYSSSGFDSLTAKKALADRICRIGKQTVILHLGDYDPSGACMFDVIAEDVEAFVMADRPWNDIAVSFYRVGLTAAQVKKYNLPTAPAKSSDSRTRAWQGETCQLEALAPDQIAEILNDWLQSLFDEVTLSADQVAETGERQELTRLLPAPGAA